MKYISTLLTIVCLVFLTSDARGQYYSYKQLTSAGDSAYESGKYLQALDLYQKAIEQNDDAKGEIIYRAGKAAMEADSYTLASDYFNRYLNEEDQDSEADALYQVARLEHVSGSYEKAIISYDLYLSEYADQDPSLTKEIKFHRDAAQWAVVSEVEQTVEFVQRLDNEVNSPKSETGPVLFNNQLFYSSNRFPIEEDENNRYKTELMKGKELFKIPGVNANQLVSNPAFNKEGNKLYFSLCDYEGLYDVKCDLYSADLDESNNPSNLTRLPDHINVPGTSTTQASVQESRGKTNLFFSSDRPGGQGKNDIYKAEIKADGSISTAINYRAVNSTGNDMTPFFHNGTETLYFSSDGREGYGGFDLYKLTKDNQEPQNLGNNINTSYNELYYTLAADQVQGHFASNRPGSLFSEDRFETCCYDIYSASPIQCLVDLQALTFDSKTREPIAGTQIKIMEKETGVILYDQLVTDNDAVIQLPCSDNYQLKISKEGYDDLTIDLADLMTAERDTEGKVSKSFYLIPDIIGLELSVFEEVAEDILNGASVYLTDLTNNEQVEQENNPGNIFNFDLKPNREYMLEINKDGFKEEVIKFNSGEEPVRKRAVLKYLDIVEKSIVSLENAIPVSLYFNNDSPARGVNEEKSDRTYTQTFDAYYSQKPKFKSAYLALFSGSDRITANDEMEYLFEQNVKAGFDKYDVFKKQLQIVLEAGQDVNIYLRGYASPLAKSEYNIALGKRRVDSIRKEFNEWNNGVFLQYLNSGQLKVTERSFGETTVPKGVSDDPKAPSKSIYSPGASKERRVEIDEIKIIR